jgi:hypothetical protein
MVLEQFIKPKRIFNANNKKDVDSFKQFMSKSAWGSDGCPFILEEPYLTIPDMIKTKLTEKYLKL